MLNPMCSAAHSWGGLGRIVYASSSEQLAEWMSELGVLFEACLFKKSSRVQ